MLRYETKPVFAACLACAAIAMCAQAGKAQTLRLSINPYSGIVTIDNTSPTDNVSLDGYQITSAAGSLVPDPANLPGVGWDSITDAGTPNWLEVNPTSHALSELSLASSKSLGAGSTLSLGKAFSSLASQDVAWGYSTIGEGGAGTITLPGAIRYIGGVEIRVISLADGNGNVESTPVVMVNPEPISFTIDGYTIASAAGSLNPATFNGFQGRGVAGWLSTAPSASALSELNLTSSTVLPSGALRPLGSLFTPGGEADLTFQYHLLTQVGQANTGVVVHSTQLAGDANNDGVANGQDIALIATNWLHSSQVAGDANYDGIINGQDIASVASHWLRTLTPGDGIGLSNAAVPEPGTMSLAALGMVVGGARLLRRRVFRNEMQK